MQAARAAISTRIEEAMTAAAMDELACTGAFCFRQLLRPAECVALLHFAESASFVDVTRLDGEAGQGGSYHFCEQAPALVDAMRRSLYAVLTQRLPQLLPKYGRDLAALERRCRAAGQRRCATIFLTFGEGGVNLAHQDPYGSLFFPYQAVLMLSRRGKDFSGGEFFVKNVKTGKVTDVKGNEGDLILFAANSGALSGADFKHGVRSVKAAKSGGCCERFSVGIVFNLRK
eukprot:TRINITY_DN110424_c0_g1_i1.p1 TRINITY_DN110424_c0_g1~~TRINITY_DN110424_c0_g1_i1.p1  ORF type:complete len:267 (-),score=64.62 TRINITY_DN110424_c0_g1_i1:44-733(-)